MSPSPSPSSRPSSSRVFLRQDHPHLFVRLWVRPGGGPRDRNQRQPVTVGGHQAHRIGLQDEQRAIEEIPGVLPGDRKLRFADHLLQHVARERRRAVAGRFRQGGEVVARQRLHARVEAIRGHLDAVSVLLDPDVGFRQRLEDLVELLRRQGERARLGNRRVAPAPQPDLEIRREEPYFPVRSFDEHVGEDGNRVLALDDSLEQLQFAQQIRLADDQFHVVMTSRGKAPPRRADPFTVEGDLGNKEV